MKQKSLARRIAPSRLQNELRAGILAVIRADLLEPGARLGEVALAERLQVSRTPVRAALVHLARRGLVRPGKRGGYFVAEAALAARKTTPRQPGPTDADRLFLAIARDRRAGKLLEEVSEGDLIRRYDVTRATVQQVLVRLSEVTAVQRKPGHGWRFLPTISDPKARAESYRLRRIIEPAALLEPGYRLAPGWIEDMRERHQDMLATPWSETTSIALYEMNAQFHEGLVAGAHNRYLLVAIQQQNRLRRFSNYDWTHGHERVVVSCREHLQILDRLETEDRESAAALMRQHLDAAAKLAIHGVVPGSSLIGRRVRAAIT
ncbi:GntR family transcriptional regulator [Bradyrhizobium sp. LTSP849]|nr:GntR family transcriptional regulator [Bradyrhizobium sp. LTSP849]